MAWRRFLWLAGLVFLFWGGPAGTAIDAADVVALSAGRPVIEIAEHAEYLLEYGDSLRFEDIIQGTLPFQSHTKSSFQFSFKQATLWIKCRIASSAEESKWLKSRQSFLVFDNASLGSVVLYIPVMRNGVSDTIVLKGGYLSEGDAQTYPFIYPVFLLPPDLDGTRPLIIRVATPMLLQFRATLYTADAFRDMSFILFIIVGFCLGILVAMLLSNMVLFVYMRDKQYLFYNLYVLFLFIWQSVLFGLFRYLGPPVGAVLVSCVTVFASLMMAFATIFAIAFLDTAKTAPRHNVFLKGLVIGNGIVILLSALQYQWIATVSAYFVGQVSIVAVFTAAVASLHSGFRPARYYLVAVGVFLLTAFVFLFKFYGWIPNNTFTMHIMLFGSCAEAILLSFALGYRIRIMQKEEQVLRERGKSLEEMSVTDELTGLFNRRFLTATLTRKIAEARRGDMPLSLLVLDMDHFKRFNDTYGHLEGDRVLAMMGKVILQALRDEDVACRYGGEEFVAILHKAARDDAAEVAERLRSRVEKVSLTLPNRGAMHMTVSIGVATILPGEDERDLFMRADQALYRAKADGRNRICCS